MKTRTKFSWREVWFMLFREHSRWDLFFGFPVREAGLGVTVHWDEENAGVEFYVLTLRLAVYRTKRPAFTIDNDYFI